MVLCEKAGSKVTVLIGSWGSIIQVHGTVGLETNRDSGEWPPVMMLVTDNRVP